ncbi:MAG: hypothetical protein ABI740_04780 [Alphaproteobacteria bacterium]
MERREFRMVVGRMAVKQVALGAGLVFAVSTLSGCADLMAKSAVAPAWFQSKAVEVKGEGYPDIHKVPKVRGDSKDQAAWTAEGNKLKSFAQSVDAQADAPIPDSDTIRATAAQMRAQTEQGKPASNAGTASDTASGSKP